MATIGPLVLGVFVGVIGGALGIGGGAMLVPALVAIYGMSQVRAQGTSIATLLAPIGIFAAWKYYRAGHIDVRLSVLLAIGFALGAWLGGDWAQQLSGVVLRRSFAVLLAAIAVRMFFTHG